MPLLVAAMGPQALRVSGELADGILPYLAGPRALAEHIVPAVTAAARNAGRPAPRIVALVHGVVTSDPDAARAAATEQLAFYEQIPSYARAVALSHHHRHRHGGGQQGPDRMFRTVFVLTYIRTELESNVRHTEPRGTTS